MAAEEERGKKWPRRRVLAGVGGIAGGAVLGDLIWHRMRHHKKKAEPDGQPRNLTLAWASPEDDLALIVAQERGFFANYQLDVTTRPTVTGKQAIAALSDEKVVGAVAAALSWLPLLQSGTPAKLIAGIGPGTFRLLVRRNSGITRIGDIVGRPIAVLNEDAADQRFFSVLLRRKGIEPNTVHWTPVSDTKIDQALAAGEVDGVVLHDPDGWQMLSDNHATLVELAGSTTGNYAARVNRTVGLSNRFLNEDPSGAVALALALRDACRWIEKHRNERVALLGSHLPDMEEDDIRQMVDHQPPPVHVMGPWLRDQVAEYADELKLLNLLPDALDSGAFSRNICRNVLHI